MIAHPLHLAKAVRQRFQTAHLVANLPPKPIHDQTGEVVGFLDIIRVADGQLRVSGWVDGGSKVNLHFLGMKSTVSPDLYRQDVAAATGGTPQVGFDLSLPVRPDSLNNESAPGLTIELKDDKRPTVPPTPLVFGSLWRRLRLLDLKLGLKLIGLVGPALSWAMTRDATAKGRIISELGLRATEKPDNQILCGDVFSDTSPDDAPEWRVTIILPIYNAFDLLPEVIERVIANTDLPYHLVLIEDASPDGEVWPWLQRRVARHAQTPSQHVTLLRNDVNLGFIGTVNRGLEIARQKTVACPTDVTEGPVILLNSDAFVPDGWASRLVRPMRDQDDVATTTPMSNDAEIFSVPRICSRTDLGEGDVDHLDAVAMRFNNQWRDVEVPTGVGFCMAMSRDWIGQVGDLDPAFGLGYGEEVDWCQRAREKGGRHLSVRNLFVEHRGGSSFGQSDKLALITKNNAIISKRYPTYDAEVQNFIGADPMLTERLALGIAWADQRARADGGKTPVYLAHGLEGGAEVYLQNRIAADIEKLGSAIVLRVGGPLRWEIELHTHDGLTKGATQDTALMTRVLHSAEQYDLIYSCGVGDPNPVELPDVLLGLRREDDSLTILVHDFFMISPRYTLISSADVFVATPSGRDAFSDPVHDLDLPDGEIVPLADWQAAWGRLLSSADSIITFSRDSAHHLVSAYPEAEDKIDVAPHTLPHRPREIPPEEDQTDDTDIHIGVLGGINEAKGAYVLQELGARIAAGTFKARLTVIGEVTPTVTLDPSTTIHGRYVPHAVSDLAQHYGLTHWLIPSVWPETFSFTTHEALATGLPVLSFDLGAQAEALKPAANGHVIPYLDDPAGTDAPTKQLVDNLVHFMHSK